MRKPLPTVPLDEAKAMDIDKRGKEDEVTEEKDGADKDKDKDAKKDGQSKDRDFKRNGKFSKTAN